MMNFLESRASDRKSKEATEQTHLNRRDLISVVIMPIFLVLLTATIGTGIGVWLQNRSFQNNEIFRARLDRIMASQAEAAEILTQVIEARRQIGSNEIFIKKQLVLAKKAFPDYNAAEEYRANNPHLPSLALLRDSQIRLEVMSEYTNSLSKSSPVPSAIKSYLAELDQYIGCIDHDVNFTGGCTEKYPHVLILMIKIVTSHSAMVDQLILEHN